jgi:hypothetical protein
VPDRIQRRAHAHTHVNEVLTKTFIPVLLQPPCSPEISTCDFFLFPKLTFHLKRRYFGTVDNIQKVVTDQLRAFPHEDFQHCSTGSGNVLGSVWLPKGTTLKGIMLIFSSVVNKRNVYHQSYYFIDTPCTSWDQNSSTKLTMRTPPCCNIQAVQGTDY